jgi:hypothetical protein
MNLFRVVKSKCLNNQCRPHRHRPPACNVSLTVTAFRVLRKLPQRSKPPASSLGSCFATRKPKYDPPPPALCFCNNLNMYGRTSPAFPPTRVFAFDVLSSRDSAATQVFAALSLRRMSTWEALKVSYQNQNLNQYSLTQHHKHAPQIQQKKQSHACHRLRHKRSVTVTRHSVSFSVSRLSARSSARIRNSPTTAASIQPAATRALRRVVFSSLGLLLPPIFRELHARVFLFCFILFCFVLFYFVLFYRFYFIAHSYAFVESDHDADAEADKSALIQVRTFTAAYCLLLPALHSSSYLI